MDRLDPRLRLAVCAPFRPARPVKDSLGTGGAFTGRRVVASAACEGCRLQQRTFAPALQAAAWAQPHAPRYLSAHAPGGGAASIHGANHRFHFAGSGLSEPFRLLECVYKMDRVAPIGIP